MGINITIIILAITVLVSVAAWKRRTLFEKMIFHAPPVLYNKEWHRLFSYGFLHANWGHLFINMFVLWMFGRNVEAAYSYLFGIKGLFLFLFLYLSAIVVSSLYDLKKQRDNYKFRAVGASGAVSAILFAYILLFPTQSLYFMFIPIPIPAALFGVLYLIYSSYMSKKKIDNIGHDSHFWGGVYGFLFILPFKWKLIISFFVQIMQVFN
jgi:membrane associated rhomboid family serine protease